MKIYDKTMRISSEFRRATELLKGIGPTVTIFGSARTPTTDMYYKKAYYLGFKLAQAGFNVITGGGDGIMGGANKGAFHSQNAASIGLSIELDLEKGHNSFLNIHQAFDFFFTRKYMMTQTSFAYVVFPGGVGTLDEFFEVLTLIQTGKGRPGKILLVGSEFFNPLARYLRDVLLPQGMIDKEDLDLFEITNNVNYVVDEILKAHKSTQLG